MKICVLIKQVASEDSTLLLNDDYLTLKEDGLNLVSNEPDTYAVEEALQLKEKTDGEVVVCTMGSETARQVLKDSLAKGADRGIFISHDNVNETEPLTIAKIIADAVKDEKFDLILSGLQSNDNGFSQIGLLVAEFLSTSHATLVMGTEIINNDKVKIKQELENGWFQWSELDLPASLTIQSGINSPRYATLKGIMSVKNKTVDTIDSNNPNLDNKSRYTVKERFLPKKMKETIKLEGSSEEISLELLNILKNKIKIL